MTIKELRMSQDLSLTQFAEKAGIDRSDLGKMESGKKNISDRVVAKIWEAFGVEIERWGEKKMVKKVSAPELEIYIQSPLGGNITPEEIAARMPEGTSSCFVRVDQNKIWWVREDGETGYVWIWE